MMEQYNLTINAAKCEFNSRSIKFFGLVFSEFGVSPDPEKIKALKHAEPPETKSDLRSFLGMLNFSAGFINDFPGYTSELQSLPIKIRSGNGLKTTKKLLRNYRMRKVNTRS